MSSKKTTTYTFRVQADGGKFLGDDIGGARIVIRDVATGALLASGVTRGDSGNLVAQKAPITPKQIVTASKNLVVANKGQDVWWLVPDSGSSAFVASLELEGPTEVELTAFGPLGGLQSAAAVKLRQWLIPGEAPPALPGTVILLPGLLVQPLSPAIHTEVSQLGPVNLAAKVTMMCGCQISNASTSSWFPDDFEVRAFIRQINGDTKKIVKLDFNQQGDPSLFCGVFEMKKAGYYEATITAVQRSKGNSGAGTVTFFLPPPS